MKIAPLVFTTILSIAWLYLLNISISKGDQKLPPLGKFFSPRTGFWQNQRLDDMKAIEEIKDQKFKGEIILDDECIPHIFANDLANAYYLQGIFMQNSDYGRWIFRHVLLKVVLVK